MKLRAALYQDVVQFGRGLIATLDLDPIYPLLKHVIRVQRLGPEQALWLLYLYLTWYNTASAWAAFTEFPTRESFQRDVFIKWEESNRKALRVNIERRGLRGGAVIRALDGYLLWTRSEAQNDWLTPTPVVNDPENRYEWLWSRVQLVPYVGRWAAFKWLDLLQHVMDWPIEPPDMRMQYCSGPRQALEALYFGEPSDRQDPEYIGQLNTLGQTLRTSMAKSGLDVTWDVLETILCNYRSLNRGHYYVGHDIDEHLEHTLTGAGDPTIWMDARTAVLDRRLLGEYNGWSGIRKPLLVKYRDDREIYCDLPWTTIGV